MIFRLIVYLIFLTLLTTSKPEDRMGIEFTFTNLQLWWIIEDLNKKRDGM